MDTFIVFTNSIFEMKSEGIPILRCPNCNSQLISSENELVCSKCGLVVDFLDRYIASYEQYNTIQRDSYYGSLITGYGFNKGLSRLQRNIFYSANKKENELKWIIEKICNNFHLGPSIRMSSKNIGLVLLRSFEGKKINLAAVAAYSVVSTARSYGLNITPQYKKIQAYLQSIGFKIRLSDLFNVISKAKEIGIFKVKNDASKTINEIIFMIMKNNRKLQTIKERETFLNALRMTSIRLFNDLKSKHYYFHGKNPMICLAAAIYAASKEAATILKTKNPVTQRELAEYIGYAEYSVRETYEEFFGKIHKPVEQLSTPEASCLTVS